MKSSIVRTSSAVLAATTAFGLVAPQVHAVEATHPSPTVLSATPAAKAALRSMNYQVKLGDTLSSISQATGVPAQAIARLNKLVNSTVRAGQRIAIPAPTATFVSAQTPVSTHTVGQGETLSSIAARYGTSPAAIAQANSIANPNFIKVGQTLSIPSAANASPAQSTRATAPSNTYTVRSGDTLSSIAASHQTSLSAIAAANGITNPNLIRVGQTLVISGTEAQAPAAAPAPTTSVPQTFLGYSYSAATNGAANSNKAALNGAAVPSRAQMQSIVRNTAVQMGVDPELALAHAYVESGFDARAVSPANAVGVMQVIPSSGEWASQMVGRELNLLDPQDNVVAGVAIIRYLQRNASSMDQGIAGYYQGLGGVRKNGMKPDTVSYVAKVKSAMGQF